MEDIKKYEVLKKYFGYNEFREGQEHLIDSILEGRDVLGIMPTGAGKSICFQASAMLLEGICIVISPLISLMMDQVNSLKQMGLKAAFLNSSLTANQCNKVIENAKNNEYKIIYVAPERLMSEEFLCFAQGSNISMVAIDEAHCVSHWGQDFRPSYVKISDFIDSLFFRPVVSAFTATATSQVKEDIIKLLKLENPEVFITGFDRKHLFFEVQKPKNKFNSLMDFLQDKQDKTGIVYCSTRKSVDEVCNKLNENGFNAAQYHAGLGDNERKINQDDFIFDKIQIMVATNAFGMGIDKSNVSFVIHYNMPKNIEAYYQEAGRAGRDGNDAHCLLLYSGQDIRTNMFLIENSRDIEYPNIETELLLKEKERERLKKMTFYCHTNGCLREYILKYFGENPNSFCGNCSSCNTNFETIDITVDAQKILSCVFRLKENYGIKTVIDVLRGSTNEKILRLRFDKLSTYGIMSNTNEKHLRNIINYLVLEEFLIITNDEYPTLKLGTYSNKILREKVTLKMKLEKADIKEKKIIKEKAVLNKANKKLMERLKKIRRAIANDEKVPAYTVFSDSTLLDMCGKIPKNDSEFLDIVGVGQVKLSRYGQKFLSEIANFLEEEICDEDTEYVEEKIIISDEPIPMREIVDHINCFNIQKGFARTSAVKVLDKLVEKGYLFIEKDENGKSKKSPTLLGEQIGIIAKSVISRSGYEYTANLYTKNAQEMLIGMLEDIF